MPIHEDALENLFPASEVGRSGASTKLGLGTSRDQLHIEWNHIPIGKWLPRKVESL
jgi:hypothetical protein